jgi:predicted O-methyltransferase YrrM
MRQFAHPRNIPIISSPTQAWLQDYLLKHQPRHCLEIGAAIGVSTLAIADLINQWWGRLTSCEISHPSYRLAHHRLWQSWLTNVTIYHTSMLNVALKQIVTSPVEFVFIDATKSEYSSYITHSLPVLSDTCSLICDDVIEYADKLGWLWRLIEQQQRHTQTHHLPDWDGLLEIRH